jgi:Zn finger protein HypA/HybF involved in hydrogenase expression
MMQSPIILEGNPFNWDEGKKSMMNAVDKHGEINWLAAFNADPGVIKCPKCQEWLWREGKKVQCPECQEVFYVK